MHATAPGSFARRASRPVRPVRVVATVALLLAWTLGTGAAAADDTDPVAPGRITVTQTPSAAPGFCLPPVLALRSATASDAESFRLRITVTAPLCAPVTATAAVYGMPGNGQAWPQHLLETRDLVLHDAGETEVRFARDCTPMQFDVVTGATPPMIAPWGEWHGPLLFPFDTSTAMQSDGCGPTPVVPEVPVVLLLPVSAAAVTVGALAVGRRRRLLV